MVYVHHRWFFGCHLFQGRFAYLQSNIVIYLRFRNAVLLFSTIVKTYQWLILYFSSGKYRIHQVGSYLWNILIIFFLFTFNIFDRSRLQVIFLQNVDNTPWYWMHMRRFMLTNKGYYCISSSKGFYGNSTLLAISAISSSQWIAIKAIGIEARHRKQCETDRPIRFLFIKSQHKLIMHNVTFS